MPDDFHYGTFIFKFFQLILLDNLSLDLFYGNGSVFPAALVNDSIATLGYFFIELEVIKADLIVCFETFRAGHAIRVH
jgi:hypothetical protein